MGEKGNAAEELAAPAGGVGDLVGSVGGAAVAGGASVGIDVASTTKDRFVEMAVDHAIDEGRDRLRKTGTSEDAPATDDLPDPPPNAPR